MASKKKAFLFVLIILIGAFITTLACTISFNQDKDEEIESLQAQLTLQAWINSAAQPNQGQPIQQPAENASGQSQAQQDNSAGTITYQPETSNLGTAPNDTIVYNSAGSKTESYTWTIINSGNYWLKVHIPNPNNQTFGPFNIVVNCQ